jgi:tape measure domain-containing protein
MAESIVKLIVDATQGIRSLGRFKKATAEAAKKTELLQKAVRAQARATTFAKQKVAEFGNAAKAAFGKAEKAAQKYQSKLGGLKGAIVSLGVAALTKRMIGQAASFAQTQVRLKALSTEYGEFGQIQQLVKDNAKTFNQSQAESASNFSDVYARLRPLGTSLEDIQTVYKGFNATALASGTSAAAASGAFLQLSQALGSGRLQGDEFRSIAEQVPGILRLVSDEMGVTVGELKQLGSDGKITSDILINSLAKGFEENKDKIQALLAESPAQKFKEFSNATSELSNAIGTELLPVVTPVVQELTKLLKAAGDLPGPIKTAGAALIGLSAVVLALASPVGALVKGIAAFAPAATAGAGAAKLLAGAMVILKGAMLALPWVAAAAAVGGLIALTVNYYKEQNKLNRIIEGGATSVNEMKTALDSKSKALAEAEAKLSKLERTGISNSRSVNAQKKKVRELKEELEGIKGVYDAEIRIRTIFEGMGLDPSALDRGVYGPGLPELPKPKPTKPPASTGTGGTAKGPEDISSEMQALLLKEQELRFSNDELAQSKIQKEIEIQRILESQLQPREKNIALIKAQNDELFRTSSIFSENFKKAVEVDDQIKKTAINAVKAAISQAAEIDAQIEAQGEKMNALYASIGQTISTGIVDSLTAAVDGTKSLAEVASNTLRSLANIMLKFGLQTFLGGLGGGDPSSIFTKLFGGGRASGGSVAGGKSYIVGERGPEIFSPGRSGSIAPNGAMGGVNVGTINIQVENTGDQLNPAAQKRLAGQVQGIVLSTLANERRSGGIL